MAAVNWTALGYNGPPITGDPVAVRTLGQGHDKAAATIDGQISRLSGVSVDEIWQSDAAVGFKEASAKLPEMLGQAGRPPPTSRHPCSSAVTSRPATPSGSSASKPATSTTKATPAPSSSRSRTSSR